MIKYAYGTIWWAFLESSEEQPGHMTKNTRPVIIVSNNEFNANHPTVTVLPMTRSIPQDEQTIQLRPAILTSIPYEPAEYSYAMCDQIRLVDKHILDNYYGFLSQSEMKSVKSALSKYLELQNIEQYEGPLPDSNCSTEILEEEVAVETEIREE